MFDFETIYNLSGPIYDEGAKPGDTLEIEIISLEPGEWGGRCSRPGSASSPMTSRTAT